MEYTYQKHTSPGDHYKESESSAGGYRKSAYSYDYYKESDSSAGGNRRSAYSYDYYKASDSSVGGYRKPAPSRDYYKEYDSPDECHGKTGSPYAYCKEKSSSDTPPSESGSRKDPYKEKGSSHDPYRKPKVSEHPYTDPGSSNRPQENGRKDTANRPQENVGRDTTFLMRSTRLENFLIYPRFLIGMDLNESAKLIYILLLNRGRMSAKQEKYVDDGDRVYVYYEIQHLADDSGKSLTTVKEALRDLEKANLIRREKKIGKHRPIYIKLRTASQSTKGSKD